MPMTTSRTESEALKCCSMCGVVGIAAQSSRPACCGARHAWDVRDLHPLDRLLPFIRLDPLVESRVDVHGDSRVLEMLRDQRRDILPGQPAHAGRELGEREAGGALGLDP